MTSEVSFNFVDHSNEYSRCSFYVPQITAANHDTVTGSGVTDNRGALHAAVNAVSLCNFASTRIIHSSYPEIPSVPADQNAQREIALEVVYVDNVTPAKKYRTRIPGVDLPSFAQQGTDLVDLDEIAPAALKLALETYAVSELGNAITVTQMRIVGRRN